MVILLLKELVEKSERRLVAPLAGYPGLKLTGFTAEKCLKNAEAHVETISALTRELKPDIAFPLMDLTVEAEAVGVQVSYRGFEAPTIVKHLKISSLDQVKSLKVPDPEKDGRLPAFLRTAELMTEKVDAPLKGFYLLGPFTLAGQLVGITNLLRIVRKNPGLTTGLIEFSNEVPKE